MVHDDFNRILEEAKLHCKEIPADVMSGDEEKVAGPFSAWVERVKTLKAVSVGLELMGWSVEEILSVVVLILQLIDEVGPKVEEIIEKIKKQFNK